MEERKKRWEVSTAPVDKTVFLIGFLVILAVVITMALFAEPAKAALGKIFNFTTNQLGFTYIWFVLFITGNISP